MFIFFLFNFYKEDFLLNLRDVLDIEIFGLVKEYNINNYGIIKVFMCFVEYDVKDEKLFIKNEIIIVNNKMLKMIYIKFWVFKVYVNCFIWFKLID